MAEAYQCRWCGGNVIPEPDGKTGVCEFCGKRIVFPKSGHKLMNQANLLRSRMEFEQAEALYQSLAILNKEDPEVWWNILLCRYGILYVQEADRRVITVNRMKYDSVFDQEAYQKAIALADPVQRKIYEEEARTIQDIQDRLLQAAAREEKYDIFISFKDKDAEGKRTIDSVLAQDIYDALTDEGYRVFFSRITLRTAVGQEFEPKIFSALQSAALMILVASTPEHVNADWVKNEWSRYLKLMDKDSGKYLLPVYTVSMKPEQLPASIAALEGILANGEGYMQLILDNVSRRLGRKTIQQTASPDVKREAMALHQQKLDRLLENAKARMKNRDYKGADSDYAQALDVDVDCAAAWWGRLAAGTENFAKEGDFHQNQALQRYYKEAMRLASPQEKELFLKDLERYDKAQREHKCRALTREFMETTNQMKRVWTATDSNPESSKKHNAVLALEEKCLSYAEGDYKKELEQKFAAYNRKRDQVQSLRPEYEKIEAENERCQGEMGLHAISISHIREERRKATAYYPVRLSGFLAAIFLLDAFAMIILNPSSGTLFVALAIGLFFAVRVWKRLRARKRMCGGRTVAVDNQMIQTQKAQFEKAAAAAREQSERLQELYTGLQNKYPDARNYVLPRDLAGHIREWQERLDPSQYKL